MRRIAREKFQNFSTPVEPLVSSPGLTLRKQCYKTFVWLLKRLSMAEG
jgi:hypothetical protein